MDNKEALKKLKKELKNCKLVRRKERVKVMKSGIIVVPIVSVILPSAIAISGGTVKDCIISGMISLIVGTLVSIETAVSDIYPNDKSENIALLKQYLKELKKGNNPFINMNDVEVNNTINKRK